MAQRSRHGEGVKDARTEQFGGERLRQSLAWFERAGRVIPGGIYGHMAPAAGLPGALPYFAKEAKGCRYRDVDGHEYIDFMCGFGPNILGYGHEEVEAAAAAQRARGSNFNHPTERLVELAESLTRRIDFADWAVFGKNGSDMTTWALQVAREHTGRRVVLLAEGAYHGVDAWCTPGQGGLIAEDRAHVRRFRWNDLDQVESLLHAHRDDVAALFVTPFHHPAFAPAELPAPGFFAGLNRLCRRHGIVLVLDDIRAGFRLHPGGSHRLYGLEPDIACYCKALGNGYPISAAVGRDSLRRAAGRVFLTGSYWNNAVAQAAA
ncbi:MAG: aminotransferase class III-fold pyridoxal phosphate-dependent enzyme, partial [Verrucomicrobiota bacterium]